MEQLPRYLGVLTSLDGTLRYFPAAESKVLLNEDGQSDFRSAIAQVSLTESISHVLSLPSVIVCVYTNQSTDSLEIPVEYVVGESVRVMEDQMRERLMPLGGMYALYIPVPESMSVRGWHWAIYEKQWISLIGVK